MKDVHGDRNVDESRLPRDTRRRRLGPWLRALAGTCLAVIMAGGPAMMAGGIAAGASALILAPAPSGPSSLLSARVAAPRFCLTASAGDSQVSLTWTPAASGSDFAIYAGTAPDIGKAGNVSTATGTSALVTGLTNGTTYYFWIVAVGEPPAVVSNMASATPAAVPGAPAGLTATPGNAQVTLSWAAPASDGGSSVSGYDLYAGTTADFNGGAPLAKVTGTVVTVTGLVNGTTYHFKVTAVNRVGEGPAAEAQAVPLGVPGAPAGLTATPGNSQVTLSWTAPASDGGSPVSGYILYQGTSPGGETGTPVNGSPVTATSYTVTGLTNGTTYYFTVVAVNAAGLSPLSGEASATLPPIVTSSASPTTPTSSATTPTTPTSSATTPTTPTSSATTPTTPTSSATSRTTPTSSATSRTTPTSSATTPTTPTSSATTPTGTASAPASTSAPTFAAPTGLTATAGNTQVTLSWTAPVPYGGSPVISYKVYIATAPGVQESAAIASTKSTGGTVTSLHNGTVYYFMVTAVNTAGNESPFSTEVSAEPHAPVTGRLIGLNTSAPTQLIALLAAGAAMAAAGVFTLIARRRHRFRSPQHARSARTRARSRQQMAVAPDVRAVPDTSRPDVLDVRDTGQEPTHTVRLEPHPGVTTTKIKEGRP
jgi:fibronectin type 3 domain-containing protein